MSRKVAPIPPVREKVFACADHDEATIRSVLSGHGAGSLDRKVLELGIGIGQVGIVLKNDSLKMRLRQQFGFTFGWLMNLGVQFPFDRIHKERERQQKLFRQNRILFTCASPVVSTDRKYRILLEEGGEVAKAVDQMELAESRHSLALREYRLEIITEITQVAAVTVAWLESLEGK